MGAWSAWEEGSYCWVVVCKNKKFHRATNVLFGHKILLGEADAFSPPPALVGPFQATCDECGEDYKYEPEDVMRTELTPPDNFAPHPLFK